MYVLLESVLFHVIDGIHQPYKLGLSFDSLLYIYLICITCKNVIMDLKFLLFIL